MLTRWPQLMLYPYRVAFFGPIYSLISLFVCCLGGQTDSLDMAMMDVAAGYFGRIHIATDSLVSMPFVRVLRSLASDHAARAAVDQSLQLDRQLSTGSQPITGPDEDFWGFGSLDNAFDLEDWSTFSRMSPNEPVAYVGPLL
jgi:hypothetical protein